MNADQLRKHVIVPTLKYLCPDIPYSESAVNLLLMTAAHESNMGEYLHQVSGPAMGIYQMEPSTEADIQDNFLAYRNFLDDKVLQTETAKGGFSLIVSLAYATAMARVHYFRVKEALPDKDDIEGLAKYAKKYYNTEDGKATARDYKEAYKKYCIKKGA